MINVVKSLLFRLKKTKMFWIMLGICAFLPILTALLMDLLLAILELVADMGLGMVSFDSVVYMSLSGMAQTSGDAGFLSMLCVSIFLCKEFSDGTIRNTILSNKSRFSLFVAYFLTGMIIGVTFLFAEFASIMLAQGIPFGFGDGAKAGEIITASLCSLLLGLFAILFVVSCVVMFLFATGKQSTSIIFPLLVCLFLPTIISSLVEIVLFVISYAQIANPDLVVNFDRSWIPLENALLYDASSVDGGLVAKIALYYALFAGLFFYLGSLAAKKDLK